MPRQVTSLADKRIRFTAETFNFWRQRRKEYGFMYDEDFAKFLLGHLEGLPLPNIPMEIDALAGIGAARYVYIRVCLHSSMHSTIA